MTRQHVGIVGGGVAGLIAAVRLARAGLGVTLWESQPELGGRGGSERVGDYTFNMGPHALYASGAFARALAACGVTFAGHKPPQSGGYMLSSSGLHALPAGPVSLLTTGALDLRGKLEAGRLLARLPKLDPSPLRDLSVQAWLEQTLHSPSARELVLTLVRLTTYTHAPERLSAAMALSQVREAVLHGVLYVNGGWQVMIDGLRNAAVTAGASIHRGQRVTHLERAGTRRAITANGVTTDVDWVVLAVPPKRAAQLLNIAAPALTEVRMASLALGLRELPRPRVIFAAGIGDAMYYSVHSRTARLGPDKHHVVHVGRYLRPQESGPPVESVEAVMDRLQPGWRAHEGARRYFPNLTVTHAIAEPKPGYGRPAVDATGDERVVWAGDWVGGEALLADASAASAVAAARHLIDRAGVRAGSAVAA